MDTSFLDPVLPAATSIAPAPTEELRKFYGNITDRQELQATLEYEQKNNPVFQGMSSEDVGKVLNASIGAPAGSKFEMFAGKMDWLNELGYRFRKEMSYLPANVQGVGEYLRGENVNRTVSDVGADVGTAIGSMFGVKDPTGLRMWTEAGRGMPAGLANLALGAIPAVGLPLMIGMTYGESVDAAKSGGASNMKAYGVGALDTAVNLLFLKAGAPLADKMAEKALGKVMGDGALRALAENSGMVTRDILDASGNLIKQGGKEISGRALLEFAKDSGAISAGQKFAAKLMQETATEGIQGTIGIAGSVAHEAIIDPESLKANMANPNYWATMAATQGVFSVLGTTIGRLREPNPLSLYEKRTVPEVEKTLADTTAGIQSNAKTELEQQQAMRMGDDATAPISRNSVDMLMTVGSALQAFDHITPTSNVAQFAMHVINSRKPADLDLLVTAARKMPQPGPVEVLPGVVSLVRSNYGKLTFRFEDGNTPDLTFTSQQRNRLAGEFLGETSPDLHKAHYQAIHDWVESNVRNHGNDEPIHFQDSIPKDQALRYNDFLTESKMANALKSAKARINFTNTNQTVDWVTKFLSSPKTGVTSVTHPDGQVSYYINTTARDRTTDIHELGHVFDDLVSNGHYGAEHATQWNELKTKFAVATAPENSNILGATFAHRVLNELQPETKPNINKVSIKKTDNVIPAFKQGSYSEAMANPEAKLVDKEIYTKDFQEYFNTTSEWAAQGFTGYVLNKKSPFKDWVAQTFPALHQLLSDTINSLRKIIRPGGGKPTRKDAQAAWGNGQREVEKFLDGLFAAVKRPDTNAKLDSIFDRTSETNRFRGLSDKNFNAIQEAARAGMMSAGMLGQQNVLKALENWNRILDPDGLGLLAQLESVQQVNKLGLTINQGAHPSAVDLPAVGLLLDTGRKQMLAVVKSLFPDAETVKEPTDEFTNKDQVAEAFKKLTGDSIETAPTRLAGVEVRNNIRKAGNRTDAPEESPYSPEALQLLERYDSFAKKSPYLFHTTAPSNLESIQASGLTTGNKPRYEGVSSTQHISFGANEATANVYGRPGDILLRVRKGYVFKNLEPDLFAGGEGAYRTTENVPPDALEIKVGNTWQPLTHETTPKFNEVLTKNKALQEHLKMLDGSRRSRVLACIDSAISLTPEQIGSSKEEPTVHPFRTDEELHKGQLQLFALNKIVSDWMLGMLPGQEGRFMWDRGEPNPSYEIYRSPETTSGHKWEEQQINRQRILQNEFPILWEAIKSSKEVTHGESAEEILWPDITSKTNEPLVFETKAQAQEYAQMKNDSGENPGWIFSPKSAQRAVSRDLSPEQRKEIITSQRKKYGFNQKPDKTGKVTFEAYHGSEQPLEQISDRGLYVSSLEDGAGYGTPQKLRVRGKFLPADQLESFARKNKIDPSDLFHDEASSEPQLIAALKKAGYDGAFHTDQHKETGDVIPAAIIVNPSSVSKVAKETQTKWHVRARRDDNTAVVAQYTDELAQIGQHNLWDEYDAEDPEVKANVIDLHKTVVQNEKLVDVPNHIVVVTKALFAKARRGEAVMPAQMKQAWDQFVQYNQDRPGFYSQLTKDLGTNPRKPEDVFLKLVDMYGKNPQDVKDYITFMPEPFVNLWKNWTSMMAVEINAARVESVNSFFQGAVPATRNSAGVWGEGVLEATVNGNKNLLDQVEPLQNSDVGGILRRQQSPVMASGYAPKHLLGKTMKFIEKLHSSTYGGLMNIAESYPVFKPLAELLNAEIHNPARQMNTMRQALRGEVVKIENGDGTWRYDLVPGSDKVDSKDYITANSGRLKKITDTMLRLQQQAGGIMFEDVASNNLQVGKRKSSEEMALRADLAKQATELISNNFDMNNPKHRLELETIQRYLQRTYLRQREHAKVVYEGEKQTHLNATANAFFRGTFFDGTTDQAMNLAKQFHAFPRDANLELKQMSFLTTPMDKGGLGWDEQQAASFRDKWNACDQTVNEVYQQMLSTPGFVSEKRMRRWLVTYDRKTAPDKVTTGARDFNTAEEAWQFFKDAPKQGIKITSKEPLDQWKNNARLRTGSDLLDQVLSRAVETRKDMVEASLYPQVQSGKMTEEQVQRVLRNLSGMAEDISSDLVSDRLRDQFLRHRLFKEGREELDMAYQLEESGVRTAIQYARRNTDGGYELYLADPRLAPYENFRKRFEAGKDEFRKPDGAGQSLASKCAFTYFILGNISTALIEALQWPLSLSHILVEEGSPILAAFHTPARMFAKAARASMSRVMTKSDASVWGKEHADFLRHAETSDALGVRQFADINYDAIRNKLEADVLAANPGATTGKYTPAVFADTIYKGLNKFYAFWSRINAETSAVAAYESLKNTKYKGKVMDDITRMSLYEDAIRVSNKANGSWGRANRPWWFNNSSPEGRTVAQLMWSLQGFASNYVANHLRLMRHSIGDLEGGLTKEQVGQARKALGVLTTIQIAGLGVMGHTLANGLSKALVTTLGYDPETDVKAFLEDKDGLDPENQSGLSDLVMYGGFHALGIPTDFQTRVAVGGLGPMNPYDGWNGASFGGPVLSTLGALVDGWQTIAKGDGSAESFMRYGTNLLPTGVQRAIRMELFDDGKVFNKAGRLIMEPTTGEKISAVLGFGSRRYADFMRSKTKTLEANARDGVDRSRAAQMIHTELLNGDKFRAMQMLKEQAVRNNLDPKELAQRVADLTVESTFGPQNTIGSGPNAALAAKLYPSPLPQVSEVNKTAVKLRALSDLQQLPYEWRNSLQTAALHDAAKRYLPSYTPKVEINDQLRNPLFRRTIMSDFQSPLASLPALGLEGLTSGVYR